MSNSTSMESRIKYIYWFAHYKIDSPSIRYRAKYPLEYFREAFGIQSQIVEPGYSIINILFFIKAYFSALLFRKQHSLIVIQRVRTNFIYSTFLKMLVLARKRDTIYDLDDAEYIHHDPRTIHFFVKRCSGVSAGSSEIAHFCLRYNNNVHKITSPVFDLGIVNQRRNDVFTIGWVGGYKWGHRDSLFELAFPSIRELSFRCRLILLGVTDSHDEKEIREYFKDKKDIHLDIPRDIDWNNEVELQKRIAQFDVGIATLSKVQVQIAKSGLKAKQYLNNGVPVICNDLPENNNVVIHGYNGFVCKTVEEFTNGIVALKEMSAMEYTEFSKNARKSINKYTYYCYLRGFERMLSA